MSKLNAFYVICGHCSSVERQSIMWVENIKEVHKEH